MKKRVAILTNLMEYNPGYSLVGIMKDQVTMLKRHGHEVEVFVNEKYKGPIHEGESDFDCPVRPEIPFTDLIDYYSRKDLSEEHKEIVKKTRNVLVHALANFDIVFTHDFIYIGWFLPYGMGVLKAGWDLPKTKWLHWVHSVPSGQLKDWWSIREYGNRHKIVFPNKTDRTRVAEHFRGQPKDVKVIPHIKDPRSWFDFHGETWRFVDEHPEIMSADAVTVLPAASDRLSSKGIDKLIYIMSRIKERGFTVCTIVANQWASGTQPSQDVDHYIKVARRNDLKGNEFVMTSKWDEKYVNGFPKRMLRELFLLANMFIFPTREESFGLVGPEASLCGVYPVFNKSLSNQAEIMGMTGLYVDFGSYHNQFEPPDEAAYYQGVADIMLGRMKENEGLLAKSWVRQTYNMDALYNRYYNPIMEESQLW